MSKLFRLMAACGLSVLFSVQAQAATFSGYAYGGFTNPVAGYGDYIYLDNNDLGYYSRAASVFNWGVSNYRRKGSQFRFDGSSSDSYEADFSVTDGMAFSLGDFTYINRATYYSDHVTSVDFDLNVNLSGIGWSSFGYSLDIENTPNGSTNEADFVMLSGLADNVFLEYQGQSYVFEILGFSRDGGQSFEDYTFAAENSYTTAEIYGRIQAVPVPAAVWLFASGLLTFGSLLRRNKYKK